MRRTTAVAIGIVVILACLIAGQANAAKPVALFTSSQDGTTNIYNPVEQQSRDWQDINFCNVPTEGIVCNRSAEDLNREGCVWDVDDHIEVRWRGDYLRPGASASYSRCIIGDRGHVYGIKQFDHPLTLTISIELFNGPDFTVTTKGTDMCLAGPVVQDWSPLRETIPDSDGGNGVPGRVTWTVTNETTRTERFGRVAGLSGGSGNLGMSTYDNRWCPSGWPVGATGVNWYDPENGVGYVWSK